MSRLELLTRDKLDVHGLAEPVTDFVARAVKGQADSINVSPVMIGTMLDALGRNKVNIITEVATGGDLIDTKITGIDSAVQAGADEVILELANSSVRNNKWDDLEKELAQFSQLAGMYGILVWVKFDFCSLSRAEQVQMIELMPDSLGLRLGKCASRDDVTLINIVNEQIRVAVSGRTDWALTDPNVEGVHTFVVYDMPEQQRTNKVYKTEGKIA